MAGKGKEEARLQRVKIASLLNEGKTYKQIQEETGCTAPTIASVKKKMQDPEQSLDDDRREGNGREEEFTQETHDIILKFRKETNFGARLIWAIMKRDPEKYGFKVPGDIPSPSHIGRIIRSEGLANKPVGSKDTRYYPIDYIDDAGMLTIDGWGPWHLSQTKRMYMVTIHDRYTRLGMGIPTESMNMNVWIRAIVAGMTHLLGNEPANTIFCDNGIGLAPGQGWTSKTIRYALALGVKRIVFSPPAQPWRNGRLENWHWRIEKEYFRERYPKTFKDAVEGLIYHINWYNMERPHGSLKYQAPVDQAPWYTPLHAKDIEVPSYPDIPPQKGVVEAIRLVMPKGAVETWETDKFYIAPIMAGQMVRVRFFLDPEAETQIGEVVWQAGKNKEPLTIATFNHKMDRSRSRGDNLVTNVQMLDFVGESEETITPPPIYYYQKIRTSIPSRNRTDAHALENEAKTNLSKPTTHLDGEISRTYIRTHNEIARIIHQKIGAILVQYRDEEGIGEGDIQFIHEMLTREIEMMLESQLSQSNGSSEYQKHQTKGGHT